MRNPGLPYSLLPHPSFGCHSPEYGRAFDELQLYDQVQLFCGVQLLLQVVLLAIDHPAPSIFVQGVQDSASLPRFRIRTFSLLPVTAVVEEDVRDTQRLKVFDSAGLLVGSVPL